LQSGFEYGRPPRGFDGFWNFLVFDQNYVGHWGEATCTSKVVEALFAPACLMEEWWTDRQAVEVRVAR